MPHQYLNFKKKINLLILTKLKKLKTKNHMNWDLSVSWTRTTRTQTQKLNKQKLKKIKN